TGHKPKSYMQRYAIQKACDLLEESRVPVETIARDGGYEDAGACRKLFVRIMGLTPGEFRQRFRE
ncbi:MAG: helix-turn-helix domain-containing protein, partial [Oceanospirillum sp.]|nr:helix-turn-helix domain-containing protein [Oceanospirillum sp.]